MHLYFPCCGAPKREFKATTCSSAKTHFITALFVALLVGGGLGCALHFSLHTSIQLTIGAAAGGSAFATFIVYLALRTLYGCTRSSQKAVQEQNKVTESKAGDSGVRPLTLNNAAEGEKEAPLDQTSETSQAKIHAGGKEKEEPKIDEDEDPRFWHPKSLKDEILCSRRDNMHPWADLAAEKGIDIVQRIEENYGDIEDPRTPELLYSSRWGISEKARELYAKECRLFLLTYEEICGLKLSEVAAYPPVMRHAISERLRLRPKDEAASEPKCQDEELTLGDLWKMTTENLDQVWDQIPVQCLGLLLPHQREHRLIQAITTEEIDALFPSEIPSVTRASRAILEDEDLQELIWEKVGLFSQQALLLLPLESYFFHNSFPQEKLKNRASLCYMPAEVLNHKDFPWEDYLKMPGIGLLVRELAKKDKETGTAKLQLKNCPFAQMPPQEIEHLFAIKEQQDEGEVKKLLAQLKAEEIFALEEQLSAAHLLCLEPNVLKHPEFPWPAFFAKPEIGYYLRSVIHHLLALPHVPWEQLAAQQDQIDALFSTAREFKEDTARILKILEGHHIALFCKNFTLWHFEHFSRTALNSEAFPWTHFCSLTRTKEEKKAGMFTIGELIRRLAADSKEPLSPKYIDWETLMENGEEFEVLFRITGDNKDGLILNQLKAPVIRAIASRLKSSRITLFHTFKWKEEGFPWDLFIEKRSIGFHLRGRLFLEILKWDSQIFPWKQLAEKEDEVEDLFSLEGNDRHTSAAMLKALGFFHIELFSSSLTPAHLDCFEMKKLNDKEFAWTHFCAYKPAQETEEGIGKTLRRLATKGIEGRDKTLLSLEHLPWETLSQNGTEFENLVAVDPLHENHNTKILRQIPRALIKDLASRFQSSHLCYFLENQLEDDSFPWDIFLAMEGVGTALLYRRDFLLYFKNEFPWEELAKHGSEVPKLFPLGYNHTHASKHALHVLPRTAALLLAPHLSLAHLEHMDINHVNDAEFPWKSFISRDGVGAMLLTIIGNNPAVSFAHCPFEELTDTEVKALLENPQQWELVLGKLSDTTLKVFCERNLIETRHRNFMGSRAKIFDEVNAKKTEEK